MLERWRGTIQNSDAHRSTSGQESSVKLPVHRQIFSKLPLSSRNVEEFIGEFRERKIREFVTFIVNSFYLRTIQR